MNALVLVSGWAAPGIEWTRSPLRTASDDHGYKAIYFKRRMPFGPIHCSAYRLRSFIDDLHASFQRIVLVGHSMGGLVSEFAALDAPVDAIVTLGTPHLGVQAARLLPWQSGAAQMTPGSQLLAKLARQQGSRPPIMAVGGANDWVVPLSRAFPARDHHKAIVQTSHVGMIYNDDVADRVFAWL